MWLLLLSWETQLTFHYPKLRDSLVTQSYWGRELFKCYLHPEQLCIWENVREMVLSLDKDRVCWAIVLGIMAAWCVLQNIWQRKPLLQFWEIIFGDFPRFTSGLWGTDAKLRSLGISHQRYFVFLFCESKVYFICSSDYWKFQGLVHECFIGYIIHLKHTYIDAVVLCNH